jgi:hypothetical protein
VALYSYVVRYDIGFAPNPFHGWCTLGTCKQEIRKKARPGDWLVGTGSKAHGLDGRLVYAMNVEEILSFQDYWEDARFQRKRPSRRGNVKQMYGDNIYHRDSEGQWIQEDSRHSLESGVPNAGHISKDTSADAVLVSREFVYYGSRGPAIPSRFRTGDLDLVHSGPAHRCSFSDELREEVVAWIRTLEPGVHADPADW